MAFCMKKTNINQSNYTQKITDSHKLANKIELEPTQIQKYGKHFLYYPSKISTDIMDEIYKTNTGNGSEYSYDNKAITMEKLDYTKEDFFFDKKSNKWILVEIDQIDILK